MWSAWFVASCSHSSIRSIDADWSFFTVDGAAKPYRTTLPDSRYAEVRELGDEYLGRNPRSLATVDDIRAAMGAS